MAENPTAGLIQEEDEEEVDYDSDGNPIAPTAKKMIIPLPPIDHSEVLLLHLPKVIVALTFLNRVLQGWHNCVGQPRSLHIKKLIGLFSENKLPDPSKYYSYTFCALKGYFTQKYKLCH